jgi:hypothetical protein
MMLRSTTFGRPFSSRKETSASPTPSSVMAVAASNLGLARIVCGGRLDGFLVARGEGAQGVLDAVAELAEDLFRHIQRVLRDEIDADALGADQADDLLDLVGQRLRRIGKQQVGFVEEENELGLVEVAGFRQLLEQFGEQPEQEGRVERRGVDSFSAASTLMTPRPFSSTSSGR